jgi:hypothetical protein
MGLTEFGEKLELRSEIEVAVAPARLWAVLLDFPRHAEWNPFWSALRGTPEIGSSVKLELTPPGGESRRLRRRVRSLIKDVEFEWTGVYGWGLLLRSEQRFRLTDIGDGRTRLAVSENLHGPGVTGNSHTTLDIARGQALMNQALKRYLERQPG